MTELVNYYDRSDAAKNFDAHLFLAGTVVQSAEMNEVQTASRQRLRAVADALFKDGDIISDGRIVVNGTTGVVTAEAGKIYVSGAIRGLAPATFTVPVSGLVNVGVYLKTSIVTHLEDPTLKDPATGVRNTNMPGAARRKIEAAWGFAGDSQSGEFYPVYVVEEGLLRAKEAPPNLDSVTQAISRYDRDSTGGGTYRVSGLETRLIENASGDVQTYSVASGRARINGYPVELAASRRLIYAAAPDLFVVQSEPHASTGLAAQRVTVNRGPISALTAVKITAEKTVTLTHASFSDAADALPELTAIQIVEVKQGGVTYTNGTDYRLLASAVDWSLQGIEPATGSQYTVKYRYITDGVVTSPDATGFTVAGAVEGTLINVSYSLKMPRIDRLCLSEAGTFQWVKGVASLYTPVAPMIGPELLTILQVYQTWDAATMVVKVDGPRVVPNDEIAAIQASLDMLTRNIAEQRLEANITNRETSLKRGIFVDPLLDDSMRDAGISQTAAIVGGEIVLPISGGPVAVSGDVVTPQTVNYTPVPYITQLLETGQMKINPYQAFAAVPAEVTLTPAIDTWTETNSTFTSSVTETFNIGSGNASSLVGDSTINRLLTSSSTKLEYLRQIPITFKLNGFGPLEELQSITFDGVSVTPLAL